MNADTLLTDLLRQVSRSFYLTLRVLPARVRPQIGLAYLLARTTDTIADTELLPPQARLEALGLLRDRILGRSSDPVTLGRLSELQGSQAERTLLEQVEPSLALLNALKPEDAVLVRGVVDTITSGQELDIRRFAPAQGWPEELPLPAGRSPGSIPTQRPGRRIVALQTDQELEDYIYRVAGCVGEFWTRICRAHLFPGDPIDEVSLIPESIRFGKGLQLINILRDLPQDLRQGRCYVPSALLESIGLCPQDLLDSGNERRFRPLYNTLLDRAAGYLSAGWRYTNSLPQGQWRVRVACALPVLIGVRTIALLRTAEVLRPEPRIKVSRSEVRTLMLRVSMRVPFPGSFQRLLDPEG